MHLYVRVCVLSFIHSGYFYSASSSPLLLRGAPDTAWILCWSFTPKRQMQLRVKELPKVPMWRLEREWNPRPTSRKASTLPMRHHVPSSFLHLFLIPSSVCDDFFIHPFVQAISVAPVQIRYYSEAARVGFELATLQTKGDESTNEPPCPTFICSF